MSASRNMEIYRTSTGKIFYLHLVDVTIVFITGEIPIPTVIDKVVIVFRHLKLNVKDKGMKWAPLRGSKASLVPIKDCIPNNHAEILGYLHIHGGQTNMLGQRIDNKGKVQKFSLKLMSSKRLTDDKLSGAAADILTATLGEVELGIKAIPALERRPQLVFSRAVNIAGKETDSDIERGTEDG